MQEKTKTVEEKNVNITKDEANIILDRIIGFVGNCDNKASIILAMYGVLFAIIFSTDAAKKLIEIARNILLFDSRVKIFLFVGFLVSSLAIIIGFVSIVFSLIAKINCKKYKQDYLDMNSVIYFGDVANTKKYASYKLYAEKIIHKSDDDYRNDIVSQIYLNSCICSKKFKKYNRGTAFTIFGFLGFIISFVIYLVVFL